MADRQTSPTLVASARSSAGRDPFDWQALLGAESVQEALDLIASLAPAGDDTRYEIVIERGLEAASRAGARRIEGDPVWWLRARRVGDGEAADGWIDRAAGVLEAWRASRSASREARARSDARVRELHRLQDLGRRAAEAQGVGELFACAAEVLNQGGAYDTIAS